MIEPSFIKADLTGSFKRRPRSHSRCFPPAVWQSSHTHTHTPSVVGIPGIMSRCHTASNYGECSRCVRQWKLGSGGRCCRPCRLDAPCLHPDAWGNMRFIQRSLISRFQNVFESLWDFRRVMDCDWDWWCCRKEGEYVQIKTFLFSLSMFLNIQMRLKDKSHKSMVVFTYAFSLAQCIHTFECVVSVILK